MSLDIWLSVVRRTTVFSANITHNLNRMAKAAGIHMHVWRPDELGVKYAGELIEPLREGIALMEGDPEYFREHDAPNGWGTYDQFVPWLKKYLAACEGNPDAEIDVSR